MKLKDLVIENDIQDAIAAAQAEKDAAKQSDLDEIAVLKTECSDYFKEFKGIPIYRGLNQQERFLTKKISVNFDRVPVDSKASANMLYNIGAQSKYGIKEVRRQSVFGTGDMDFAGEYGEINFMIPVNSYKAIYSKNIKDIVGDNGNKIVDTHMLQLYRAILDQFDATQSKKFRRYVEKNNRFTIKRLQRDAYLKPEVVDLVIERCELFMDNFYTSKFNKSLLDNEIAFYNISDYYLVNPQELARRVLGHSNPKLYSSDLYFRELYHIYMKG